MTLNHDTSSRQHAYSGPELPQLPEPTHAERVRTLVSQAGIGTLSTWSRRHEGYPFGSLMPYALSSDGRPIFLISNMAMHTQNLKSDPRASLFVAQADGEGDPLGLSRATLVGRVTQVSEADIAVAQQTYTEAHANSRHWVEFEDFGFFRLDLVEIYYVGGFGVMGWVDAREYRSASPDPLAIVADGIIQHMNADHGDAMIQLARAFAGIEAAEAIMTSVDRLGLCLRLRTTAGIKGTRINFLQEVRTSDGARRELLEMVRQARQLAE